MTNVGPEGAWRIRKRTFSVFAAVLLAVLTLTFAPGEARAVPTTDPGDGGGGTTDTTAPTVTGVSPAEGATNVPRSENVRATFSEDMDSTTITTSTFTLVRQGATTPVAATVGYDAASKTATLDPSADLDSLATYTATVTTGAKDAAGNALDQDPGTAGDQAKTWSFTVRDHTAPNISGLSPSSGVQRGTITLSASASDNSGVVSRVEFRVREVLVGTDTTAPYATSFNTTTTSDGAANIRATAFDAAGNSSSAQSNVTIDNTPPTLTITSGPDGQTFGPNTTQTWNFSAGDATSGLASVQCSVVTTGSAASFGACSGGNTSHSVTNKPDGSYTFTVRARDNGGLETTQTRTFSIDATPPDTRIDSPTQEQDPWTTETSATFTFSSIDDGTATFECRFYVYDDTTMYDPTPFGACSGEGTHTVNNLSSDIYVFEVRARDAAGNVDQSPAEYYWAVDTIAPETLITSGPSGPTNDSTPTFTFTGSDNLAIDFRFAHKVVANGVAPDSVAWSDWSSFLESTSVTLGGETGLSDDGYTIFVKSRDRAGNEDLSPNQQDFTVDTTVPGGTMSINAGAEFTNDVSVSLTLSANDPSPGSGVDQMRFSNDGSTWSAWEPYASSKPWTLASGDGTKTVHVQYKDGAGNVSMAAQDTIKLDTTAPGGTVSINGGDAFTSDASVNLTLSATDPPPNNGVDQMRFSNDGSTWSAWGPYASSKPWTLASGDGTKTVHVEYRDGAGNVSTAAQDSITLDTSVPTVIRVDPLDAASGVSENQPVTAFFSEQMDEASVEADGTFTLVRQGTTTPVGATVSYNNTTGAATLDPSTDLDPLATYTATITSGAKDLAGHPLAAGKTWSFSTSDTRVPSVRLTAPTDGSTVGGTVQLSADATDSGGIDRVEFLVNGEEVGSDATAPYGVTWNSTSFNSDGARIAARAIDTSNNVATSTAHTVTVNNTVHTAPETTLDPSGPSGTVTSTSATFSFSSEAGATFECSLDSGPFELCASPKTYTGLSNGPHTFSVRARNQAGNVDASPASRAWTVDATAPTVLKKGPTGRRVSPTAKLVVFFSEKMDKASVEAEDAGGLPTTLTLKKGATRLPASVAYVETATGQYKAILTPNRKLRSGTTYTATVTTGARDAAGNALAAPVGWRFTVK